jgi:hypothetical protein
MTNQGREQLLVGHCTRPEANIRVLGCVERRMRKGSQTDTVSRHTQRGDTRPLGTQS